MNTLAIKYYEKVSYISYKTGTLLDLTELTLYLEVMRLKAALQLCTQPICLTCF